MISYYAWIIFISFILAFGFGCSMIVFNKYLALEAYCRRLIKQRDLLQEELNKYIQTE